jgi:hypothetical protein
MSTDVVTTPWQRSRTAATQVAHRSWRAVQPDDHPSMKRLARARGRPDLPVLISARAEGARIGLAAHHTPGCNLSRRGSGFGLRAGLVRRGLADGGGQGLGGLRVGWIEGHDRELCEREIAGGPEGCEGAEEL